MATGADQTAILLILRSLRLAENEQRDGIMTPGNMPSCSILLDGIAMFHPVTPGAFCIKALDKAQTVI